MRGPTYYEEAPFLGIAESLLKLLEEDFISSIIFVTSSTDVHKRKLNKFTKSFGKFPNATFQLLHPGFPKRDEINKNNSDFDVYIDDSPADVSKVKETFPDRIYVMPNYRHLRNLQQKDVWLSQNDPVSLKNEDFTGKIRSYSSLPTKPALLAKIPKELLLKKSMRIIKVINRKFSLAVIKKKLTEIVKMVIFVLMAKNLLPRS